MRASVANVHHRTPVRITMLVGFSRHQVYGVNQVFTRDAIGPALSPVQRLLGLCVV